MEGTFVKAAFSILRVVRLGRPDMKEIKEILCKVNSSVKANETLLRIQVFRLGKSNEWKKKQYDLPTISAFWTLAKQVSPNTKSCKEGRST